MSKVRVLRLIEYTYDTPQRAEEDMAKWQMPANGTRYLGGGKVLRSAIITDLNFEEKPNTILDSPPGIPVGDVVERLLEED